jgi:peptidyl-prolyl cis-trans isomerase SurA
LVNPYTGTSKFSPNELDPYTSYMVKKLKTGQLSAAFAATDQRGKKMYKIIKLISKTKPHVANLDQDYQLFKEKAMAEKQGNVINEWIKNKIENSYIKIDPTYQNCTFEFEGWVR